MQLLIFIAAIGFFVLRILASSKKKQPETAENGAANRFAENESDEFAFGTGFAQGKPKPAAQNRTEGRAYSASDSYCGTANCTGGSIHEGAHEGEVRAPRSPSGTGGGNMRSNASSGKKTAASQTAKKTAAKGRHTKKDLLPVARRMQVLNSRPAGMAFRKKERIV